MGPMLWNPENPCTSTIGYGRCSGAGVSWPVGQLVPLRGTSALGMVDGVGVPATLALHPMRGKLVKPARQATKALASAHFIAVRPPTMHLRSHDPLCQVSEFVVLFTHCVNYMSHR